MTTSLALMVRMTECLPLEAILFYLFDEHPARVWKKVHYLLMLFFCGYLARRLERLFSHNLWQVLKCSTFCCYIYDPMEGYIPILIWMKM